MAGTKADQNNFVKRFVALCLGCVLLTLLSGCRARPSEADQKWLMTVEKLVQSGQTRIATSSQQQVAMLKDWAEKHNFAVGITKGQNGYRVDLVKRTTRK